MRQSRRWLVLGVVLMGTFMAVLDVAIVNVAIPSIRADLGASYGEIEFVVSAYTLTYACLLVTGGRLGDNYGRKLLFIVGLIVFGAASAGCGMAPTTEVLIAARAVQGIGGALMYPQVLAIIQVNFADQERRQGARHFRFGHRRRRGRRTNSWRRDHRARHLASRMAADLSCQRAARACNDHRRRFHPAERRTQPSGRPRLGRRCADHGVRCCF